MVGIRELYLLAKPGIVYGNAGHTIGGMLLAASTAWSLSAAIGVMIGVILIVASACVVNNLIDRPYDARMQRTKRRPSVTGQVTTSVAVLFAITLALIGFVALWLLTNPLTTLLGLIAYVSYTVVYTYSKRFTVHSTLIGTIPGALPAMAGYTALVGQLDSTAWLIGLVIACWQLPHFYAISVFRAKEYAAAGFPVLSTRHSSVVVKRWIIASLGLFFVVVSIFAFTQLALLAGIIYVVLAGGWLMRSALAAGRDATWARRIFGDSMYVSLGFVAVAALDLVQRSLM